MKRMPRMAITSTIHAIDEDWNENGFDPEFARRKKNVF